MSQLPMEIINTILNYHQKEYYWNRFVKRWHIRFIRIYLDEKFSYLFEQISTINLPGVSVVLIHRKYCRIHMSIFFEGKLHNNTRFYLKMGYETSRRIHVITW
jgi:hypothetical protein